MKIDYAGKLWDFELEEMTVGQCEAVEKYCGKGLGEWANQMSAGGVKAIVALWWVMRKQSGESPGPISEPGEDFRPVKLLSAFHAADVEPEPEPVAEPDPTGRPSASSPEPRGTPATPASDAPIPSLPG